MTLKKAKADSKGLLKRRIWECWELYAFLIPSIILTIIFRYVPLYGLQLAFKDLVPGLSISESPWVGLKHFQRFFSMPNSGKIIWNTFKVAVLNNLIQFPFAILFALMLNQVRNQRGKKLVQNISYMPHLLSAVITISIASILLAPNTGLVNILIKKAGGEQILFFGKDKYVVPIYVITGIWQNMGYNAIVYIAALAGIDQEQLEAARIDGASRLKTIWYIELPSIADTIIIMLVLSFGQMFAVGADKMLLIQTCLLLVNGLSKKLSDNSVF